MVKEISDNDFDSVVINNKKLVLVDFWAPWCGPCKQLSPILEDLSKEIGANVEICKLNIDDNPEVPSKLGIRSIPTLMLFKDGKNIATKVGSLPKTSIIQWINDNSK